jgi:hypothetical protein
LNKKTIRWIPASPHAGCFFVPPKGWNNTKNLPEAMRRCCQTHYKSSINFRNYSLVARSCVVFLQQCVTWVRLSRFSADSAFRCRALFRRPQNNFLNWEIRKGGWRRHTGMGDESAGKSETIIMIILDVLPQTLVLLQGAGVAGICLAMAADELLGPVFRRYRYAAAVAALIAKQQSVRSRGCPGSQFGTRAASSRRLSAQGASARVRSDTSTPSRPVVYKAFHATLRTLPHPAAAR